MDANDIIRDPRSGDDAVLDAVSRLRSVATQARVWTDIANDSSYRTFHRDVAIYELFRRHFIKPSTLGETASLLAGGSWLADAVVEKIETISGEIPVAVPAGGASFIVRFAKAPARADAGVYLALDRDLDADLLRDALMSRNKDPGLDKVRIVDFALFPPDVG
ncbi:MAG TPA: hypothetical protein VN838_23950 [Bradyrhizobium sp.]|nr:hypothetical protein [Bradyrhizobium sp.]